MLKPMGTVRAPMTVLTANADSLYQDLRLVPLLQRLINASCALTEAVGGSISVIDAGRDTYTKTAERGTPCRLGQSFPVHEGVTGRVMRARRPVVLSRYSDLSSGHLPDGHPAADGPVAAIPIWWLGNVVGVNVIFAGTARHFSNDEVDRLEALTQLAAPGFIAAAKKDLSSTYGSAGHMQSGARASGADVAPEVSMDGPSVADLAFDLLDVTERASLRTGSPSAALHVAVVPGRSGQRLLVQYEVEDEAQAPSSTVPPAPDPMRWQELVDQAHGGVAATAVPGTPVDVSARERTSAQPAAEDGTACPSPFSPREQQVAALLACGLGDRAIAHRLVISPKTVEKHVGSVLRKTGTTSRTAAVVRSLAGGWLDEDLLGQEDVAPD